MAAANPSLEKFRFGPFEANLRTGELRKNGRKIRLERQPFSILGILLHRRGDLVQREELYSLLWPNGTFVEYEHSLNKAVSKLRAALGDSTGKPCYVETLAQRGYRFMGNIEVVSLPENGAPTKRRFLSSSRKVWLVFACAGIVLAVGIAFLRLTDRSRLAQVAQQRILTGNPADNDVLSAVISPDGRSIAYSDKAGITLLKINSGETRLLPGTEGFQVEAWFPNGEKLLAVRAVRDGARDLFSVSLSGAPLLKLREDVNESAVSNDGTHIVFSARGAPGREIWLMGAEGENPRSIVPEAPGDTFMDVAWSPDDRRLLDLRRHKTPQSNELLVETRDLNGAAPAVVLSDRRLSQAGESGLCWLHDGRVVYSLTEPSPPQNQSSIWGVFVDSKTGKAIGNSKRIAGFSGFDASALSASADGKKLTYLLYRGHSPLFVGSLEENGTRLESPRALTSDQWDNVPSTWLRESDSILFFSIRSGGQGIYRLTLGKGAPENLVTGSEAYSWPELSPDGKWLLYWAEGTAGGGPARLLRQPISGGPPQTVLTPRGAHIFHCARARACVIAEPSGIDGGTMQSVFTAFDPIKGRDGELARMDFPIAPAFDFALSPDGEWVAGVAMTNKIKLLHLADGATRDITVPGWKFLQTITWSADGARLYVTVFSYDWNNPLLSIDLEGNVRSLLENRHVWLGYPIASPNGHYLAWHEVTAEQNVGLLENF